MRRRRHKCPDCGALCDCGGELRQCAHSIENEACTAFPREAVDTPVLTSVVRKEDAHFVSERRMSVRAPGARMSIDVSTTYDLDLGTVRIEVRSPLTGSVIRITSTTAHLHHPPPALAERMVLAAALFIPFENVSERWLRSQPGRAACFALALSTLGCDTPTDFDDAATIAASKPASLPGVAIHALPPARTP